MSLKDGAIPLGLSVMSLEVVLMNTATVENVRCAAACIPV